MTNYEKRCEDCACLVIKNKVWCCDECFGCPIEEVSECPEGVTLEEIKELDEKAKNQKINHGAREKVDKKDKKPKTVKVSDEKAVLFAQIFSELQYEYGKNAQILKENKLITVQIGEKTFKVDIIEQRPPKK